MEKIKELRRKYVPVFFIVVFFITLVTLIVFAIAKSNVAFADGVNATISTALRTLMSFVSFILPFSLCELLILAAIPAVVVLIVLAVKKYSGIPSAVRTSLRILAIVGIILCGYIYSLAIPYHTTALADRIGVEEDKDITPEELYATAALMVEKVNSLCASLPLEDGQTHLPYSMDELSRKLSDAYERVREEYPFFFTAQTRAKPILFSGIMADMGLSGIYTYFTGESNINLSYPDYNLPYTVAHEFAHQRGIIRENEANFIAHLVCISSDDQYIQYAGYLGLFCYLSSSLYSTDKQMYSDLLSTLSPIAMSDLVSNSEVIKAHSGSFIGELVDRLNDSYLKMNGTDGIVSYGYVTRLAVAYYKDSASSD